MGKAFGILLIVLGIWVGLELYTEGTQNAFGGLFVKLGVEEPPPKAQPAKRPLDAIRDHVSEDVDQGYERRERLMDLDE